MSVSIIYEDIYSLKMSKHNMLFVFGILELLGTLLGGLGGSLGSFFGINTWAAPWVTFSDL